MTLFRVCLVVAISIAVQVLGLSIDHNRYYYEHLSYYRDPFSAGVKVPEPGRNFFAQVKLSF